MRVIAKFVTAILLLFFLFPSPSTAAIKSINIRSDDRPLILFRKFGFTHIGNVSVTISNLSVTPTVPQLYAPSIVGFFLLPDETLIQLMLQVQHNPYSCALDSKFVSLLFTFGDISSSQSFFHKSYTVTKPNDYSLFFANCNLQSPVTMDVRTELYNIDDGTTKDYLSARLTQLPSLYYIFSLVYLCFIRFWISVCFKNKPSVHRVHVFMCVLLTMKALSVFCDAEDKHYVKVMGTPHGWNVLHYMFQFISDVLLFSVIVLIGAGWLYLKPSLQAKEKAVLMIVIMLQVPANVASIVMGETGPFIEDWVSWNLVFLWADAICCSASIFPIVWSIRSLNEVSKTDEKAGRNLSLFRRFFLLVIGYLYVTRIGVYALNMTAAYMHHWVCSAAEELANLLLYLVMFYMFRPVEKSEYFVLNDEDEQEHDDEDEHEDDGEAAKMAKG